MKYLSLVLVLFSLTAAAAQDLPPPLQTPADTRAALASTSLSADALPALASRPADRAPPLTLTAMVQRAHWVVQGVMALLAGAAALSWTVALVKTAEITVARLRLRRAAATIRAAESLTAAATGLARRLDPASFMVTAAQEELRRSEPALAAAGGAGLKERVRSIATRTEAQAAARLRRGIGLLATIGATAPFVGLFGTVWGIMNAFVGIAEARSSNLAVVAPGIAEALLATAFGLVAAIPAVVLYNGFVRALVGWRSALADAGAGVERLLSRDLDFRAGGGAQ